MKKLYVTSSSIKEIPYINNILESDIKVFSKRLSNKNIAAVAGWALKKSGLSAKEIAKNNKIQFYLLEDGFIRSFNTGKLSPPLSIVLDDLGIYYDSYNQSSIESLLSSKTNFSILESNSIVNTYNILLINRLSKYNHSLDILDKRIITNNVEKKFPDSQRVLVIDQTYKDMSVICGGASEESFANMVDAALAENSEATIYIKTHPEVTSGRKKGYLTHIQDSDRIVMIREDVNPIDLIQKMDKVYVVTSQMGFEALMCGKPVVCFGVPWYAGWGVTDDRVKDSPAWARRSKKRTIDELFAAAYLHYTRYLNPFTHERGTIFDVIEWLVLQRKMVANQFKRSF